jgi:hypothetical protein
MMLHQKTTRIDLNSVAHFLAVPSQRAANSLSFYQKTARSKSEPLHFITDFKSKPVRENAHFTGFSQTDYNIQNKQNDNQLSLFNL